MLGPHARQVELQPGRGLAPQRHHLALVALAAAQPHQMPAQVQLAGPASGCTPPGCAAPCRRAKRVRSRTPSGAERSGTSRNASTSASLSTPGSVSRTCGRSSRAAGLSAPAPRAGRSGRRPSRPRGKPSGCPASAAALTSAARLRGAPSRARKAFRHRGFTSHARFCEVEGDGHHCSSCSGVVRPPSGLAGLEGEPRRR